MVRFCVKEFDLKLILIFLEAKNLPEIVNGEISAFIQKHWTSIRTFSKKGKVQSIYNFLYNQDLVVLISKIVDQILQFQLNRFKLNYSFGYILRNICNEELRYYHASYNNNVMMSTARLINNRQELIRFLNAPAEELFYDKINRPDTKWKVVDITNITFYVNHLKDAPFGAPVDLPHYIKNNHGLRNVSADKNLCFFLCLAVHRVVFDFIHLEDFFELNLIAYKLDGKVAKLVQRSREFYQETMRLNVFGNHLSAIVDFELYCGVYQCVHCDKLWDHSGNHYRHTKSCTTTVREVFLGAFTKILPLFLKNWRK